MTGPPYAGQDRHNGEILAFHLSRWVHYTLHTSHFTLHTTHYTLHTSQTQHLGLGKYLGVYIMAMCLGNFFTSSVKMIKKNSLLRHDKQVTSDIVKCQVFRTDWGALFHWLTCSVKYHFDFSWKYSATDIKPVFSWGNLSATAPTVCHSLCPIIWLWWQCSVRISLPWWHYFNKEENLDFNNS